MWTKIPRWIAAPTGKAHVPFRLGDKIEARRISPTEDHASAVRKLSSDEIAAMAKVVSPVGAAASGRVKDENVTLSGARQAVRGEVTKVKGDQYAIKDHHGNDVRFIVNQNTRMWCGAESGSMTGLLPDPSASDKTGQKGSPQDLSDTNKQQGSEVGPGTKSSAAKAQDCVFKTGDKIEAEISDMGAATLYQDCWKSPARAAASVGKQRRGNNNPPRAISPRGLDGIQNPIPIPPKPPLPPPPTTPPTPTETPDPG